MKSAATVTSRGRSAIGITLAVIALSGALFGAWVYLGTPIPASLVGLNLPFMGRQEVVTHDTTFYAGADLQSVMAALVASRLFGDVGGLCDRGVTCEGRQIIKAGTHVRVLKKVTMQNTSLNVTFAHVQLGDAEGWIAADAVE